MAPLVAALIKFGFSTIAGAVASKGADVIKDKLGIDIGDALGTEQGRIQLKTLEMQHQEFLVNAAQASEARDLDYFKEEVKDRDSARDRDAGFMTAGMVNWRGHFMFGLLIADRPSAHAIALAV